MDRLLLFASFETDASNHAMNRYKSAKNKSSLAIWNYVIMAVFDGWESRFHSLNRFSSMACCFDMAAVDIQEGKGCWRMRFLGKNKTPYM